MSVTKDGNTGKWMAQLRVTDWTGKRNTPLQIHAGSDLLMGGAYNQTEHILSSLADGSLSMKDLDRAATKVLELVVKSASFQKNLKPSLKPDLEAHATLARETAADGMVLLKNNGALPMAPSKTALFGVYSYDLIPGGNGAAFVNCPYVVQINEALKSAGFSIDPSLENLYKNYASFTEADMAINHIVNVHVGKLPK